MRHASDRIILDVEFLRAVAIIFTVFHHLPFLLFWRLEWFQQFFRGAVFWSGVDLFFCISGFVIMRSFRAQHLDDPAHDHRTFRQVALPFWMRRAWRLWPAAWIWLIVPLACAAWFNHSGVFGQVLPMLADAGAAFVHLANFHWIGCLFYNLGSCNSDGPLLIVYWSLSLEEQFYLLFPVLIFFAPRKYLGWLLGFMIAAQLFLHRPYLTPGWALRTDALLLGVALALWQGRASYQALEPVFLKCLWISLPLTGGLLALLVLTPSERFGVGFSTGLLALLCAVLVWIASYGRNYLCPEGFFRKIWVWIGSRSYSLYLIHLPAFALTREIWWRQIPPGATPGDAYTLRFVLSALILLGVFAELNFRFVEAPLRQKGKRMAAGYARRFAARDCSGAA